MRCLLAGVFCCWVTAALLPAQPADQRARRIIDDAVAALGGDTFLTMQDRVESGRAYSFYRDELTGLDFAKIYTQYLKIAPGKSGEDVGLREREAFGKNEETSVLFREDGAWDVSWRGAKDLEQDRVDRFRDSTLHNIFYIFRQRLHEPGMSFDSRGSDVIDNQPVDIVDVTDSENRVVTVYFHQTTKLPVRQMYSWRDPKTHERNDEETRYSRYRDTGGVKWPFQITRERNGEKVFEIFSDSVSVNQGLADSAFSKEPSTRQPPGKKK